MSTISTTYIRCVKLGNTVLPTSRILFYRISGTHKSLKKSDLSNGAYPVGFCTLQPRTHIHRLNGLSILRGLSTKLEAQSNKNQNSKEPEPYILQLTRKNNERFGFSVSHELSCQIDKITQGSLAENSDLKVGDKIFAVNRIPVSDTKEIENIIRSTGPAITLNLYRAGTFLQEGPADKDVPKILRYSIAVIIYGLVGFILFKAYNHYTKKQQRRNQIEEYLPKDIKYKATFPLVKYRGCVLPEDMIMSGTMEEVENFILRPEDIIIASFPKSGTTWAQEIVHQVSMLQASKHKLVDNITSRLQESSNSTDNLKNIDLTEVVLNNDETMELRVPYLENGYYPGIKEIEKRKGRRLIKTHLPSDLLPPSAITNKSKIIYIYRNPKDVIVSYYNFARMLTYCNYKGSLNRFSNSFINESVPYSPYFPHIDGYFKLKKRLPESILIVSYEDIKARPKELIRKIADFVMKEDSCTLDDEEIGAIEKLTSFEAMKHDPRSNYEHWDTFGIRNSNESKFMRSGTVGDYKNHMSQQTEDNIDEWVQQQQKKLASPVDFKFNIES